MPNTHATLASLFSDIADAIRAKKGEASTVKYVADNFPTAISNIPTGGGTALTGVTRCAFAFGVPDSTVAVMATKATNLTAVTGALYYLIVCSVFSNTTEVGQAYSLYDGTLSTLIDSGYSGAASSNPTYARSRISGFADPRDSSITGTLYMELSAHALT